MTKEDRDRIRKQNRAVLPVYIVALKLFFAMAISGYGITTFMDLLKNGSKEEAYLSLLIGAALGAGTMLLQRLLLNVAKKKDTKRARNVCTVVSNVLFLVVFAVEILLYLFSDFKYIGILGSAVTYTISIIQYWRYIMHFNDPNNPSNPEAFKKENDSCQN